MGTPIKRSIGTIQQHQHCTFPPRKSPFFLLSLLLPFQLTEGFLKAMEWTTFIQSSKPLITCPKELLLNTMEARLEGLSGKKDTIDSAFAALKNNLDKTKLGTNSADNKHDNLKWNDEDKEWVAA